MDLAPPLAPMLARLARSLPVGPGLVYEPKWDGFRCLAFRRAGIVDLRSRHDRPLARYFPELVDAFERLSPAGADYVLDGELVVISPVGTFDFAALLARLHPAASRVERLRRETPAHFIAFDLLAHAGDDVTDHPFAERRKRLEAVMAGAPAPLLLTPATEDPEAARGWLGFAGGGVDGVVVKPADLTYQPGKRAMVKVKPQRTADCVVGGFRLYGGTDAPLLSSLQLGLHDAAGTLRHVGMVGAFTATERSALLPVLAPHIVALEGHPWAGGFGAGPNPAGRLQGSAGRWTPDLPLDWVPIRPVLVVEVAYDQLDGDRFRHPARFQRWRPDRDPRSCTFEQFAGDEIADAAALLGAEARV